MSKQGIFLGIPYDWRRLTKQRLKSRIWNEKDSRLFTPKAFGWGFSINFYELFHNRKNLLIGIIIILGLLGFLGIQKAVELDRAHSTFENYYAFRGCTQLLKRTGTYGICKTSSSETIKIVKFHEKWYLSRDLPCGFLCF